MREGWYAGAAGATGYIGNTITQELARAGVETTALIRSPKDTSKPGRAAKISHLESLGVSIVKGDISNSVDELASILKRFDTVIAAVSGKVFGPSCLQHWPEIPLLYHVLHPADPVSRWEDPGSLFSVICVSD